MSEKFNTESSFPGVVSWGNPGSLLLPSALCRAWAEVTLPAWAIADLGISSGDTVGDLFSSDWPKESFKRKRIENYLCRMLQFRLDTVCDEVIVGRKWPEGLNPLVLPFSTRTKNCVRDANLNEDGQALIDLKFGELLSVPGMGPRSALDLVSTLEAAMHIVTTVPSMSGDLAPEIERDNVLLEIYEQAEGLAIDEISSRDPRFRDVMPPGTGTLSDRLDRLSMIAEPELFLREAKILGMALPEIKHRADELAAEPLDVSLRRLFELLSNLKGDRIDVLIDRFGWAGIPPITLEDAGQRLHITRERIRQIQKKIYSKFPDHPLFLPQLRKAISSLNTFVPAKIDVTRLYLKAEGITTKAFDPRSVIAAASDCGIECSIQIQSVRGKKLVVSEKQKAAAQSLIKFARKQVGASGATNVSEVVEQVLQEGFQITEKDALRLLRAHEIVSFLADDWFWIPSMPAARNRMRNVARKMLAVTSPMRIPDIRGGLRRVYFFRNSSGTAKSWPLRVPPTNVLTEFFKQHSEFEVDKEGRAYAVENLDYRKELWEPEQIFVDALRSTPSSVLDRQSLLRECRDRGLNDNSFGISTSYSPILSHVDLNIWTLRGVDVNPAAVEALRVANALRPREKRLQDYGWTTDGKIWIATRIPELYESYICGCPGAVVRFLQGRRFRALGEDGLDYGTIGFSESHGTSYGYNPFLRRVGAEQGDILISEFDLNADIATLKIGDFELLDAMDET
ncbi:MAG: hypothetical protein OER97_01995 [Gammaproteobacteria bacterium]|nr:hypothetical protein [Gammaproteobacteria bacterium]